MPNEIYHRSDWGESKAEGFGDVYYDHAATNKLYNHSDYYENSDGTDATLKDLNNKASIVLTPTAYSDGSLNTVIPPYQVLPTELVTNGNFDDGLNGWSSHNGSTLELEDGKAKVTTVSGQGYIKRTDLSIQSGKTYFCKADITNATNPVFFINGFSNFLSPLPLISGNTYGGYITTTGNNPSLYIRGNNTNGQVSFIDNVSVKEVQEADFDFSRGSSATRVNEQGLVEDVQILSGELVQNGNFEQIGSELVTNGNFDTDSDWIKGTGWSISGGVAIANNVPNLQRLQGSGDASVIGNIYKYSISVSNVSGAYSLYIYGVYVLTSVSTEGIIEGYVTATSTNGVVFIAGATTDGLISATIDNVSVKEVGQNWTFGGEAIIDNGLVSFVSASNTYSYIRQDISSLAASLYRISIEVKNYVSGAVQVGFQGSSPNLQNLNVSADGVYTVELSPNANGDDLEISREFAGGAFDFDVDNISVVKVTNDTDLPRIDFTDGTGSLLLEPQRTNLINYSEDFSGWSLDDATVESDSSTSPDGNTKATLLKGNTNSSKHHIRKTLSGTVDGSYSIFAKAKELRYLQIASVNTTNQYVNFDLQDGLVGTVGSDFSNAKIEEFSSGWYRLSVTSDNRYNSFYLSLVSGTNSAWLESWVMSNNTDGLYIWGAQLEQGSYATSYIVSNSGSATTRSADVANNSGNADLFNDSEGVLYAEIAALADDQTYREIAISDGASNNRIEIRYTNTSNTLQSVIRSGGTVVMLESTSSYNITNFNKIAVSYKANEFKMYVNSTEVAVDTSGNAPTGLKELAFDDGNGANDFYGDVKCIAVFKEALSNDLLERLTGEGYESFRLLAEANNYTII